MDLSHIFKHHSPTCAQVKVYEKLREAFREYAEALTTERVLNEEGDLVLELAYEDIIRVINELVPDSPEYDQAVKYIDQAYDLAIDPNRAIVQAIQAACYFANAAVALENHG